MYTFPPPQLLPLLIPSDRQRTKGRFPCTPTGLYPHFLIFQSSSLLPKEGSHGTNISEDEAFSQGWHVQVALFGLEGACGHGLGTQNP